jgi:hypothetical protein
VFPGGVVLFIVRLKNRVLRSCFFICASLFSFLSLLFLASFRFYVSLDHIYNLPRFLNSVIVAHSSLILITDINVSDVTVTARSNAWICGRSLGGVAGSNPAGGMDVCLL